MADSKRKKIRDNVKTTLESITAENDYTNTVAVVHRGVGKLFTENNLPCLFIITGSAPAEWMTNQEYSHDLHVLIIGKISVNSDAVMQDAVDSLAADVFKAMHVDINRGNAAFVLWTRFDGLDPVYDIEENKGYFYANFTVRYVHDTATP